MAESWDLGFIKSEDYPITSSNFFIAVTPKKKLQRNFPKYKLTAFPLRIPRPDQYSIDTNKSILNQGKPILNDKKFRMKTLHTSARRSKFSSRERSRHAFKCEPLINFLRNKQALEQQCNVSFLKTQRINIPKQVYTNVVINKKARIAKNMSKEPKEMKEDLKQRKSIDTIFNVFSIFKGSPIKRFSRRSRLFADYLHFAKNQDVID